ncbi:MAG: helix-turn-helix domain-containing protein [Lachnospiraceae bacterium]|nr:helix-turn-helix domain-containing protein [Lachnospiraceae bacterium]
MDKNENVEHKNYEGRILKQTDLYEILPFQKTKIQKLIKSGELPLVKVGKDYITTFKLIEEWISNHIGEEIYY